MLDKFLDPGQLKFLRCYRSHCTQESRKYCVSPSGETSWFNSTSEATGEVRVTRESRKLGTYSQLALYGTTLAGCVLSRWVFVDSTAPSIVAFCVFPFQTFVIASLFRNYVLCYLLMPSQLVGNYMAEEHAREAASRPEKSFPIETADGQVLDAMEITTPVNAKKWIVWMNTNGVMYEDNYEFSKMLAATLGVHILLFNYRGVGNSSGSITTPDDMIEDGKAAVGYLNQRGIDHSDILVHGHSMGGAVAVKVRCLFPGGPVTSDRSFGSLLLVISEKLHGPMRDIGQLVVAIIGMLAGGVLSSSHALAGSLPPANILDLLFSLALLVRMLHFCVPGKAMARIPLLVQTQKVATAATIVTLLLKGLRHASSLFTGVPLYKPSLLGAVFSVAACSLLGCAAGLMTFVPGIGQRLMRGGVVDGVVYLVKLMGWELNPVDEWFRCDSGRLVIYNRRDGMITYPNSLHQAICSCDRQNSVDGGADKQMTIDLRQRESAHMNWLNSDRQDWEEVVDKMKQLLA